jgi:hypothetical protein
LERTPVSLNVPALSPAAPYFCETVPNPSDIKSGATANALVLAMSFNFASSSVNPLVAPAIKALYANGLEAANACYSQCIHLVSWLQDMVKTVLLRLVLIWRLFF